MNAPWVSAFTVIEMSDWSLLFIGERLAHQDHITDVYDLVGLAGKTPFTLSVVEAFDTKLEAKIEHDGRWDEELPLSRALELAKETQPDA